ncbi:unnamed protein product [Effrenium voratum]|nr:unnamed protein product [Effrenium voratum]
MQRVGAMCLLALAAVGLASNVTPVQKVVSMMEKMLDKGKAEMDAEKQSYVEYEKFCEKTTTEKARAISEAEERSAALGAAIDKASSDVDQLGAEIEEHGQIIDKTSAEKTEASSVREKEAADFAETLKDYVDSITAIGKAMTVLKEQPSTRPQALLQLQQRKLSPREASDYLNAFLHGVEPERRKGQAQMALVAEARDSELQPAAAGYEFQSGGVISLLENLEDQFKEERNTLKMEELKKKNAFKTLVAGLDSENSDASKDKERKLQEKASIAEQKAKDESELAETQATLAEDTKYKKDLEMSWRQKAAEFKSRQKLRAEELEAISKATEIISGSAVAGNAEKHLPKLLQTGSALAAVQSLRSPSMKKVAQLLQDSAAKLQSQQLSALALRVLADPIDKVKELIQGMVARMEEEAASEATKVQPRPRASSGLRAGRDGKPVQSPYHSSGLSFDSHPPPLSLSACASGLSTSSDFSERSASLAPSSSLHHLGDIVSLKAQLKDSSTAMAEATDLRTKEKKENTVAIEDAKAAQLAVAEALTVLQEFYAKAGEATALVQGSEKQPSPFGATPYQGMGSESGGVIGMIEVIQGDFARLEAETSSAENAAAKEYDSFMEDSKLDVAAKEKDVAHTSSRKEAEAQKLSTVKADQAAAQEGLEAATKVFEKLKPQCADSGASYQERKAKRDAEIQSLEQALDALKIAR